MDSWHSYPKIFNVGHAAVEYLLKGDVIVEEKIDGSQFSFGVDGYGEVRIRSKGKEMPVDAPEKMFERAVETVLSIKDKLHPGYTYRAEYLQKPKHNTLAYDRVPDKHLALFDVNDGHESYLPALVKCGEAELLGIECVPFLFEGRIESTDQLLSFLDRESVLGGQKIEGVVIKPAQYDVYGADKKVLMAKYVSECFKEIHGKEWKKANPSKVDILESLIAAHKTPSRWDKAVQHLKESGDIEGSPRDIGKLINEIKSDTVAECEEEIKEALWRWAKPKFVRGITAGFPEYYKEQLARDQLG